MSRFEVPVNDLDPRVARAAALLARGRCRQALRLVRDYLREHPQDVRARLLELSVELEIGRRTKKDAIALGRVLVDEPLSTPQDHFPARLSFATVLYRAGEREEGRTLVQSLLREDPDNARAHAVMGFTLFQDREFSGAWDHLKKSLESGYDLGSPDGRRVAYQLARKHGTKEGRALVLEKLQGIERWVVRTSLAFMTFYLIGCGLAVAGQSVKSTPIMLLATAVCGWLAFSLAYLCWGCCTKAVLRALGIVLVLSWTITLWPGFSENLDRYSWVFGVGLGLAAIVGVTILVFQALAAGRDPGEASP